jgi:hypothetical protein
LNNHRLCAAAAPRIVMRMKAYRYPTIEEVRAIENAARRARREEIRRLIGAGIAFVRKLCSPARKGLRHA